MIDEIEALCKERALKAFNLDGNEWHVNVHALSGTPANFAVQDCQLEPGQKVMGLDLPSGGHLSHGQQTAKGTKISSVSKQWESQGYQVNDKTGWLDMDSVEKVATEFKPDMLVCGTSAQPRDLDYKRFRQIADKIGSYLLCDMAHISGMVASGHLNDPFLHCDVVTTTTHKSLRGPRSGMIFCRKEWADKLDFSVFPGLTGGPHNHQIAALATQLKEVCSPEWNTQADQMVRNSLQLAKNLQEVGFKLVTDGTDNHICLIDLRPMKVSGAKAVSMCDLIHITLNKNAVHGDTNAALPGGIRVGSPALTSRGFKEKDMKQVALFVKEAMDLCKWTQDTFGAKKLKDFQKALTTEPKVIEKISDLDTRVQAYSEKFATWGSAMFD